MRPPLAPSGGLNSNNKGLPDTHPIPTARAIAETSLELPPASAGGDFRESEQMNAPRAYYNEHDPHAAQWLRNLIAAGEIAPGDVDERDIRDVRPAELDGYRQCHFFAGIGIWSRALRTAGWPDERPVWTGSCPCQPFSAAGAALGFDDERHLWPDWHWLIEQHRPETVLGEQVASSDGLGWADLVSADLEATGYACGFVDTCAAGFRSYHIRQRLYFAAMLNGPAAMPGYADTIRRFGGVVNSLGAGSQGHGRDGRDRYQSGRFGAVTDGSVAAAGCARGVADAERLERDRRGAGKEVQQSGSVEGVERRGDVDRLADAAGEGPLPGAQPGICGGEEGAGPRDAQSQRPCGPGDDILALPSDGYWRDADWLFCRDGVWRPVGPGTFPLVDAAPARMGRLRAYGNGLDLAQATGFVRAFLERDMGKPVAGDLFEFGELT